MSQAIPVEATKPGRPRSERARVAILEATVDLLRERGLREVSVDEIARRAGVSKATIYRWWESKEAVALDAFLSEVARVEGVTPDTGSLAEDLAASLRARGRALTENPWMGRTMASLVAETHVDSGLRATYLARIVRPLRDQARAMIRRAMKRGEVPSDIDVEATLDLVYGPMYHRVLQGHAPLTDRFARKIADLVVRGVATA